MSENTKKMKDNAEGAINARPTQSDQPWSDEACMGYAKIAMERARLRPDVIKNVLRAMKMTLGDTSVELAADQYTQSLLH